MADGMRTRLVETFCHDCVIRLLWFFGDEDPRFNYIDVQLITSHSEWWHLWWRNRLRNAVATGGNQWQKRRRRTRPKQAKTLAVGCHRLPRKCHGKAGVGGSSPPEGFTKAPQIGAFSLAGTCRIFSVR
jgi:hypothetical protein